MVSSRISIKPFDKVGQTTADVASNDARYLKLSQTTPQTVINGAPTFNVGLSANDNIVLKAGKKLIFDGA